MSKSASSFTVSCTPLTVCPILSSPANGLIRESPPASCCLLLRRCKHTCTKTQHALQAQELCCACCPAFQESARVAGCRWYHSSLRLCPCCLLHHSCTRTLNSRCRRRSYLLLCGLAGSVSWLALATLVHSPTAAVGAMLLGSLSTACSDVVVDSLVVERARGEPAVRYCLLPAYRKYCCDKKYCCVCVRAC